MMSKGLAWYNPARWFDNSNNTSNYYQRANDGSYVGITDATYNASPDKSSIITGVEYDKMNATKPGSSGGLASIGAIGSATQGLAGLANAYLGYKNYQLAKDQFGYEKALGNANLYNQGTLVNTQLDKSAEIGNALAGGTMTDAQKQANLGLAASRHVKTSI